MIDLSKLPQVLKDLKYPKRKECALCGRVAEYGVKYIVYYHPGLIKAQLAICAFCQMEPDHENRAIEKVAKTL